MRKYQVPQLKSLETVARSCGSGGCCSGNIAIEKELN